MPIQLQVHQLAWELLDHVPFGMTQNAYHGETQDAGSMALFVRGVTRSSLRIRLTRTHGKAVVTGVLLPRTRTVIAVDLLQGGKRVWTRLAKTDKHGEFQLAFKRPRRRYVVHAFWQGDLKHGFTASWKVAPAPVLRPPATVKPLATAIPPAQAETMTMSCPGKTIANSSTPIGGSLNPAPPGQLAHVRAIGPGTDEWLTVSVGADGRWQTKFAFPAAGEWQLTAYFFGTTHQAGAAPVSCSINAE